MVLAGGTIAGTATGGSAGGAGATTGYGFGGGIFVDGNTVLNFSPAAGQTLVAGSIADKTGSDPTNKWHDPGSATLAMRGAGMLALNQTNNFSGGILIAQGTVRLGAAGAAGSGAIMFGTTAATLQIASGAAPSGTVTANAAYSDTLDLLAGTASTLSGIGTRITNFRLLTFDAGAQWTVAGTGAGFQALPTITGFGPTNTIDITDAAITSELPIGAGNVVTLANGVVLHFDSTQNFAGQFINLASNGVGGTDITESATLQSTLTGELTLNAAAETIGTLGRIAPTGGTAPAVFGAAGTARTLFNAGTLDSNIGVSLIGGGTVYNQSGGLIHGGIGVSLRGAASIANSGLISATSGYAIALYNGGLVTNMAGSVVGSGGIRGQYGAATVDNSGTIIGNNGIAVRLNAFQTNRVIDRAGGCSSATSSAVTAAATSI